MKHKSLVLTLTFTLPFLLAVMILGSGGQILLAAETSIGGSGTGNINLNRPGPASSTDNTQAPATGGQIIVKLLAPLDSSFLVGRNCPFTVINVLEHSYTYLLQISTGVRFDSAKEAASASLVGAFVEPNYLIDELHPVQGSYPFSDINHSGDYQGQWPVQKLGLSTCHSVANGNTIKIGIIDGGIDFGHTALDGQALSGYDFVGKDTDAFDELGGTVSGHGTFVAGVVHLTAPMASIVSYRVIDPDGKGDGFTMAQAIERAVDDGCKIINISLVLTHEHLAVNEAIAYAVSQGVVIVGAAGNDNIAAPIYPAANPNVISVAAVDTSLKLTSFSNFGSTIDICAPGSSIYSAYQGSLYAWWSGTSFAAPFVTGQIALMKQYAPTLDPGSIHDLIISTGININSRNPQFIGLLGGGLANPPGALMELGAIAGDCCTNPGDINNNGIPFEFSEMLLLMDAIRYGDTTYLGSCIGNADIDGNCTIDFNDLTLMNNIIIGDTVMYPTCGSCQSYTFVPGTPAGACCTMPGDINSNGLPFEVADSILLYNALATGDTNYLAPCIGNADLNGDCLIDTVDRAFMRGIITGEIDIFVYPPVCGQCQSYQFIPDTGGSTGACCTLPGDINSNGLAFEVADSILLYNALATGDTNYLAPCIGNADLNSDCLINASDLEIMRSAITTDTTRNITCASCQSYTLVTGVPPQECWTMAGDINNNGISFEVADSILLYNALHTGNISYLQPCIGNADITFNCQIDTFDLRLMRQIITGDTVVYLDSNFCRSYEFIPVTTGADSAYVYATPWRFSASVGEEILQAGNLVVGATGDSKFFNVSYLNTPNFIRLMDTVGFTNDSIFFEVASSLLPPGPYIDSLIVYVDGASNSPLIARIYLMVDSVYGPSNQAWAHGIPHLTFITPEGKDTTLAGHLVVGADIDPKPFSITVINPVDFIQLSRTQGITTDTIDFNVISTASMAPGYYTDSLIIAVDSVTNSPLLVDVLLIIEADTVYTRDSMQVIPEELMLQVPYGSADSVHGSVVIYSSNAPAPCSSHVQNKPSRFIYLPQPYGTTPDSLEVVVFRGNKAPGVYHDTIWIVANGCDAAYLYVNMEVLGAAKSGSATELGLANYPNPFNSTTELTCNFPAATKATLRVYDILGREVVTLVDGYVPAGPFRVQWNGTDHNGQPVASGIYLYRLQAGGESVVKRMILLK